MYLKPACAVLAWVRVYPVMAGPDTDVMSLIPRQFCGIIGSFAVSGDPLLDWRDRVSSVEAVEAEME